MSAPVDLYNHAYGNYGEDVYRRIREETYGEDLGQTSWVTSEESNEIPRLLELDANSYVLEVGSGSGRYALKLVETTGCRILGVDLNTNAVATAKHLAAERGMTKAQFEQCDVSRHLPYPDNSFDALFSNDVLCHVRGRSKCIGELFRVLKPGHKLLFSDALVISGTISHEEIARRSSIGYYLFSPTGENERILEQQGLRVLRVDDTSANAAAIAGRWRNAREKYKEALVAMEGAGDFDGLQSFLACVHTLTSERRLLRRVYLAEKP